MTAPKNDKARKSWLAGLNDEDTVIGCDGNGFPIRSHVLSGCDDEYLKAGWRYFSRETGQEPDEDYWIYQYTPSRHFRAKLRAMSADDVAKFTDAQILAVSAILWPGQVK